MLLSNMPWITVSSLHEKTIAGHITGQCAGTQASHELDAAENINDLFREVLKQGPSLLGMARSAIQEADRIFKKYGDLIE